MPVDREHAFNEHILAASDVPLNPLRCPHCQHQNLILRGNLAFPHEEIWDAGAKISEETDMKVNDPFELSRFACLDCDRLFIIESDGKYELRLQVQMLLQELAKLQGSNTGEN